jgi:hypothetical protein
MATIFCVRKNVFLVIRCGLGHVGHFVYKLVKKHTL